MNRYVVILVVANLFVFQSNAQSNLEPALAYNLLDIQNSGSYMVIGNFKVKGSPYLFGGKKKADIFAKKEFGSDVVLSYNTYNQDIEFDMNGNIGLTKSVSEVDSFILKPDGDYNLTDLFFINSALVGSDEKCFFQIVSEGSKYDLYKKYSSRLEISSTNYVQSDLRYFALSSDYYYLDKSVNKIKKIKLTKKGIINEFKATKDLSADIKDFNLGVETENVMKVIFTLLNK